MQEVETQAVRGNFNEIASLLHSVAAASLEDILNRFPQFRDEVRRGPDAGSAKVDREYANQRASFSIAMCNEIEIKCAQTTKSVFARASALGTLRVTVATVTGATAIAFLGSLGINDSTVSSVAAVLTSGGAIITQVLEVFGRRYSPAVLEKATVATGSLTALKFAVNDLEAALSAKKEANVILLAVEACNSLAREIANHNAALHQSSAA